MTEITTYHVSGTGIWLHDFYDAGRNKIGSVGSAVVPSAPVQIYGCGLNWHSQYDLVSKAGQQVIDNNTGSEKYRIINQGMGFYEVRTPAGESVYVELRDSKYLFGLPERPVTALTERIEKADWMPSCGLDVRPRFKTIVYESVNDVYLMMILSFPVLRF